MCGRTACTLRPDHLQAATSYRPSKPGPSKDGDTGKFRKTRWVNPPGGKQYQPSHNVAPTDALPVLVRGEHASHPEDERVLMPMRWGLVPHFHRGELRQMTLSTFNARSEEFMEKAMFSRPFNRGQRCAIVCDGYYEWKRNGAARKPYFIYADGEEKWDRCSKQSADSDLDACWSEDDGWTGRLLTVMAGIFEQWRPADSDQPLYSVTILTQPANSRLSWVHHRMPVFLDSAEAVSGWISDGDPVLSRALITPNDSLSWHPVSPDINSVANKSATFAPVTSTKAAGFMAAWLKKGAKQEDDMKKAEKDAGEEGKAMAGCQDEKLKRFSDDQEDVPAKRSKQ